MSPAPPPSGDDAGQGGKADDGVDVEPAKVAPQAQRGGCFRRWLEGWLLQQDEPWVQVPLWLFRRPAQGATAGMCAVLFGALGAILLNVAASMYEKRITYTGGDTHVVFSIDRDLQGPVLFSYEVPGIYVNQKGFIESKDQFLTGSLINKYSCDVANDLDDVRWRRCTGLSNCSADGVYSRAVPTGTFRPCGLVAVSMFTDTYELVNLDDGTNVSLDQKSIALPLDDEIYRDRFVAAADDPSGNRLTVEGQPSWVEGGDFYEHFKVWYRTPASPHVRNLWAKIHGGLTKGRYELRIPENSVLWTQVWIDAEEPTKTVVLSQESPLGSLGACQTLGIVCTLFCFVQVFMTFFFLALPLLT